jgi:hypothetical protein
VSAWIIFLTCSSESEETRTRLGKAQFIKAIDDGGISMCFEREPQSPLESRRIVLSVEVNPLTSLLIQAKRKKHAKKDHEETASHHAAQIFAEMLGQVCRPELYEKLQNQYQEVIFLFHYNLYQGVCDSYSTFKHLLILCQIAQLLSRSDFLTRSTAQQAVSYG